MENNSRNGTNEDLSSSTILTTRYGHEATRLIHLVEKNLYLVMIVIAAVAILSLMNILGVLDHLYSRDVDYTVDVMLSIALVAVLAPLFMLIVRSRKVLDRWKDMFETNTITTAMSIAMADRTKEEAVSAIVQSVAQISLPFHDYIISSKSNLREFLDVSIDNSITFDILMDADHVLNGNNNNYKTNNLKSVLKEYGAIIINIIDRKVEKKSVESFVNLLLQYISKTKNQVGLGIIIGEEISAEAREYTSQLLYKNRSRVHKIKINNLILIQKSSLPSPSFSESSHEVVMPK